MTDNLIETIRAALAPDATPEARAAGVTASRAVLTALGAEPGQPLAPPPVQIGPTANAIAGLIRSTPPDQLLDLLIAKLSAAVPAATHTTNHKMTIPFVKVPRP